MNYQYKIILGGLVGNLVEAYDISICYFLASTLSKALLGSHNDSPIVFLTLILIAYLIKPIGAFILGLLSDRYGRKNILMSSIVIMGGATSLIGLIPNYDQIGLWALFLFLLLRIVQNLALGSEFLNSASFMIESGEVRQRGFLGCWPSVGVKLGFLAACLVSLIFQQYIMHPWAWRVPFLLATLTMLLGFYVRFKMPESLGYILYYADKKKPSTQYLYQQSMAFIQQNPFLAGFAFLIGFFSVATGFFFYLYMPVHAKQYSNLASSFILFSTSLSLLWVSLLIPLFGWISDRYDRLNMLYLASIGLLLLVYPFIHAINYGEKTYFMGMQLMISIPCACYYSVATVIILELFPLAIRCTALSVIFSIAASLGAGLPPILAHFAVKITHMPNAPSLFIVLCAIGVILMIIRLRKTYRIGKNDYLTTNALQADSDLQLTYYLN